MRIFTIDLIWYRSATDEYSVHPCGIHVIDLIDPVTDYFPQVVPYPGFWKYTKVTPIN